MNPKVSIQIPTYNQHAFIKKSIESCLMQDYLNLEINIADDHSSDDTFSLVQPYVKVTRLKYFTNGTNIGRVANYHKALYSYSSGDWVVNLDGDDQLTDPRFISYAMELITRQANDEIVMFQANHNLEKIRKLFPQHQSISDDAVLIDGRDYFLQYYTVRRFRHCATLFKRSAALPLNFYSFDCLFTDFNSMSKLFLKGKIIICGKTVASWHLHEGNQSSGLNEQNIQKEFASIQDIAAFAKPFFTATVINQWKKKMQRYMVETYIELLINMPQQTSSLKYIIKQFHWDMIYFKQLIKYFIRK